MMKQPLYFLFPLLILSACDNEKKSKEPVTDTVQFKSALMSGIYESDTAYFLFYDKPGEHRFYKISVVDGRDSLQALMQAVNDTISALKEHCVTEGKIHFYGKSEAVYTIYFNSADSCMTLSFMHQGNKYFTSMSTGIQTLLRQQAALTKKEE
jgi:hypothetical protein